jgi:DNA-directed RNA polymerase specialized sigma24 family protein
MTPAAFEKLLACLNPDQERAGEEYERVRRKLIIYFEARKCAPADEYADEVINRVARKLDEGEEVREIGRYFFGVARYLRLEILRQPQSEGEESNELRKLVAAPDSYVDVEDRLEFLERCLAQLPAVNREMVIKYYEGEKREKIDNRDELAKSYGLSINALKIRVCRIRSKLEDCINECMNRVAKAS